MKESEIKFVVGDNVGWIPPLGIVKSSALKQYFLLPVNTFDFLQL